MHILVTGSAGHVGKVQLAALLEAGYEVRTFDRRAQPMNSDVEHIPGDLRDINAVRRAAQGMDAVVHVGAIPNDHLATPDELLAVNVQGTWNVLLACTEAGIERMVYYSSVNALGSFGGHRPSKCFPIDDTYAHHPQTPYQLSKHLAEETCKAFSDRHGMVTICLRPVGVYDQAAYERWRHMDVERRIEWGRIDYWCYVDVRDVCRAAILALEVEGVQHDSFLLATDHTMVDVPTVELVDRYYPDTQWTIERESYFAENPYRSLMDCSHALDVLGWRTTYCRRDVHESPDGAIL